MDQIDLEILEHLQRNARLSLSELGRIVHLSQPAASERVRKLEESGAIRGYGARVDSAKVGLPLLAFVRMRYERSDNKPLHRLIEEMSEILECHHVTGEDCYIFKLAARSMEHLESLTKAIGALGPTTTSLVYSSPLTHRPLRATE
jgi:Lrp/AsnC family transcriptional regulator, leucine-responsive regulatory protein